MTVVVFLRIEKLIVKTWQTCCGGDVAILQVPSHATKILKKPAAIPFRVIVSVVVDTLVLENRNSFMPLSRHSRWERSSDYLDSHFNFLLLWRNQASRKALR